MVVPPTVRQGSRVLNPCSSKGGMCSLRSSSLEVRNVGPVAWPFLFHLPASRIFPCVNGLIANESDFRGLEQGGNTGNPKVDYEICFSLDWPGGILQFCVFFSSSP